LRYEGKDFKNSDLLKFLFENVTKSPKLAANFYWNICIESETVIPSVKKIYEEIGLIFWTMLAQDSKFEKIRELLAYQMNFRDSISKAFDVLVQNAGKSKDKKKSELRKFLKEKQNDIEDLFQDGEFFVFKGIINQKSI
jgi:hypothetical protein